MRITMERKETNKKEIKIFKELDHLKESHPRVFLGAQNPYLN